MKSHLTILAGAAMLVLGAQIARAEDAPEKPKGPPREGPRKERLLNRFDTNKDGALSKSEIAAMPPELSKQLLEHWDTNKDGELSKEEVDAIKPPPGAPGRPGRPGRPAKGADGADGESK